VKSVFDNYYFFVVVCKLSVTLLSFRTIIVKKCCCGWSCYARFRFKRL